MLEFVFAVLAECGEFIAEFVDVIHEAIYNVVCLFTNDKKE